MKRKKKKDPGKKKTDKRKAKNDTLKRKWRQVQADGDALVGFGQLEQGQQLKAHLRGDVKARKENKVLEE